MKVTAIIAAAGSGSRMGLDINKLLIEIDGVTVIERTLDVFNKCDSVDDIVVVTGDEEIAKIAGKYKKVSSVTKGSDTRQKSVFCGIDAAKDSDVVCIHDGARCFVSENIIKNAIECAKEKGACTVAVDVVDTLRTFENDVLGEMISRDSVKSIQTPQCFKRDLLLKAYEIREGNETDETLLVSKIHPVYTVEGSRENIKITTKQDLSMANAIVKGGK